MKFVTAVLFSTAATLAAFNACGDVPKQPSAQSPIAAPVVGQRDPAAELLKLTDVYMAELLAEQPYLQMMAGGPVKNFPDNSFAGAQRSAQSAQALLEQLAAIDVAQLGHDDQITHAIFKGQLEQTVAAEQHFWHKFNITPYAVGATFNTLLPGVLSSAVFEGDKDIDNHLAFLLDVARYLKDDLARLEGQEKRGILLPQAALPGARTAIAGIGASIARLTLVAEDRLTALDQGQRARLTTGIDIAVKDRITPALDTLQAYLGDDYTARAPTAVGLGQYPGGTAAYQFAIRRETTMDLDPEDIHRRGLEYMAGLQQEMAAIRKELGFDGSRAEFHQQMRSNPRFFVNTPEEVAARYMAYIRRIEPRIKDYFSVMPKAPYGVKRLDLSAEPGMTFGYYQAPSPSEPVGNYRFNGSKLESRPMVWAGALIYHELIPGHHFHIALQRENEDFSEFRKSTGLLYAAFTEGWANYAASLSYEMGIMDDPWDRYGWLLFNSFITNRLVVDTGMNHLGWSLEKAREYMMENTFSSEEEVATETLRYSTDMPAQSLAYKLGYEKIRDIRRAQEEKLGQSFDIKKFHAATVGSGAMPLPLLEDHVAWYFGDSLLN